MDYELDKVREKAPLPGQPLYIFHHDKNLMTK